MPRVVHFEIYADNPERAIRFYETVFGWQVHKWEGPMDYWLICTGKDEEGINGAIMQRDKPLTGSGDIIAYVCTIGVDSVTICRKDPQRWKFVLKPILDRLAGVDQRETFRIWQDDLLNNYPTYLYYLK